ncbi:MAG: hypothetical protein ACYDH2_14210 [Anaerolineaceae bacterium]
MNGKRNMNIWFAREEAIRWLGNELKAQSDVIEKGFDYIGHLVTLYETIGNQESETWIGQYCRVLSITLAKSLHILLGCYSLAMDGLAQESGALLRPLIETHELLIYLRQDKSRIMQVIEGNLPTAGKIGKEIAGENQALRDHLNDNASHFSYKKDSIRHLFAKNASIKSTPTHSIEVFRKNLNVLNALQYITLEEGFTSLDEIMFDVTKFAKEVEEWRIDAITAFPNRDG